MMVFACQPMTALAVACAQLWVICAASRPEDTRGGADFNGVCEAGAPCTGRARSNVKGRASKTSQVLGAAMVEEDRGGGSHSVKRNCFPLPADPSTDPVLAEAIEKAVAEDIGEPPDCSAEGWCLELRLAWSMWVFRNGDQVEMECPVAEEKEQGVCKHVENFHEKATEPIDRTSCQVTEANLVTSTKAWSLEYPRISSCLTITVIFRDDFGLGAHFVLQGSEVTDMFERLIAEAKTLGTSHGGVVKVLVAGVVSNWGTIGQRLCSNVMDGSDCHLIGDDEGAATLQSMVLANLGLAPDLRYLVDVGDCDGIVTVHELHSHWSAEGRDGSPCSAP
mmetsp:Transcript_150453/g.382455  ORF Transcript_150453/g.382455 Transcript_150453/m.382455 type:complete len:335 (-) Transcript_150453:34-1038(-)